MLRSKIHLQNNVFKEEFHLFYFHLDILFLYDKENITMRSFCSANILKKKNPLGYYCSIYYNKVQFFQIVLVERFCYNRVILCN